MYIIFLFFIILTPFTAESQSTITQACNRNQSSMDCLVCNCYHESRGEIYDGKVAVNKVVMSRAKSKAYPNSICGVIWQRAQFSWTADRIPNNISIPARRAGDQRAFRECQRASEVALQEGANGVLNFYNPKKASPRWARSMRKCGRVGNHLFLTPKWSTCPGLKHLGASGTNKPTQPKPSSNTPTTKERTRL